MLNLALWGLKEEASLDANLGRLFRSLNYLRASKLRCYPREINRYLSRSDLHRRVIFDDQHVYWGSPIEFITRTLKRYLPSNNSGSLSYFLWLERLCLSSPALKGSISSLGWLFCWRASALAATPSSCRWGAVRPNCWRVSIVSCISIGSNTRKMLVWVTIAVIWLAMGKDSVVQERSEL